MKKILVLLMLTLSFSSFSENIKAEKESIAYEFGFTFRSIGNSTYFFYQGNLISKTEFDLLLWNEIKRAAEKINVDAFGFTITSIGNKNFYFNQIKELITQTEYDLFLSDEIERAKAKRKAEERKAEEKRIAVERYEKKLKNNEEEKYLAENGVSKTIDKYGSISYYHHNSKVTKNEYEILVSGLLKTFELNWKRREEKAKDAGFYSYAEMLLEEKRIAEEKKAAKVQEMAIERLKAEKKNKAKKAEEKRKIEEEKRKIEEEKRIAIAKKAEEEKIKKKKESEQRILSLIDYPGFRDLKPGLTYEEVLEVCPLSWWTECYGIDNIKFKGDFSNDFLAKLTLDMGPIVETGGFLDIFGEGDSNIFIKMKNTFDKKYTLDYGYSERDRQLFNEFEKSSLYRVYSKGQVVIEISRKEKDWSTDLWLYIHYLDATTSEKFLEENRPVRASEDDF